MAVTSSGAGEGLACTSLFTYDVYRRYIKPKVGSCSAAAAAAAASASAFPLSFNGSASLLRLLLLLLRCIICFFFRVSSSSFFLFLFKSCFFLPLFLLVFFLLFFPVFCFLVVPLVTCNTLHHIVLKPWRTLLGSSAAASSLALSAAAAAAAAAPSAILSCTCMCTCLSSSSDAYAACSSIMNSFMKLLLWQQQHAVSLQLAHASLQKSGLAIMSSQAVCRTAVSLQQAHTQFAQMWWHHGEFITHLPKFGVAPRNRD